MLGRHSDVCSDRLQSRACCCVRIDWAQNAHEQFLRLLRWAGRCFSISWPLSMILLSSKAIASCSARFETWAINPTSSAALESIESCSTIRRISAKRLALTSMKKDGSCDYIQGALGATREPAPHSAIPGNNLRPSGSYATCAGMLSGWHAHTLSPCSIGVGRQVVDLRRMIHRNERIAFAFGADLRGSSGEGTHRR